MKYQNTKTGFVFDSDTECAGEDWVKLDPLPAAKEVKKLQKVEKPEKVEKVKEEKPVKAKRTKKDGISK